MSSVVKGAGRKRNGGGPAYNEAPERTLQQYGLEVAALAPGDPLRYALGLSLDELRSLRRALGPVFERRPSVRRVFEAIIGYKEREMDKQRVKERRQVDG